MQDGRSAQFTSLFNGFFVLAATMAKAGLLDRADLARLHSAMTKPLDAEEHAGNEGIAEYQQLLEHLISTISTQLE